jgi:hypothetical protein
MTGLGFEFPVDNSGQWDGFNDPNIEHFAGNRLQHLGREVPQNTIDAKVTNPAQISVRLIKVPTASLPGHVELTEAVKRCRAAAADDQSDKAVKFFENAAKLLAANEIQVLQIRDANTTGLTGPCVNGTPFFAMLKATGQSQKPGTATGSYGIGKFAPFAVSDIRTVFVSTVWADNGTQHHYVQGKSVLMSHLDDKGKTRRGTGFWGVAEQCQPVTELISAIPNWLRMSGSDDSLDGQNGTMLSIIGFSPDKGWQNVLAANFAENFFGAIERGELEVEIEDGPTITAGTLGAILGDDVVQASVADRPGEPERFANIASYLKALQGGDEVEVARSENLHLGTCELRILVGENLPKRVAVLRNGMLITEALPGLKRFSDFKEFAAVLECTAEKGLALLRAMEPPRHDAFEPDRLPADRRSQGRTALRELADWVRKMLIRHAKDPVAEEINLDELADYFGYEEEEGGGKRREENPGGRIIIRARAVKPKGSGRAALGASAEPEPDEEGDDGAVPGDEGREAGGLNPDGPGGESQSEQPRAEVGSASAQRTLHSGLALADVRAVPLGPNRRRVAFTPAETGRLLIELQDSGTDTNYALRVAAASRGTVEGGRIAGVEARSGERLVLDVELEAPFVGTLRVVANAV